MRRPDSHPPRPSLSQYRVIHLFTRTLPPQRRALFLVRVALRLRTHKGRVSDERLQATIDRTLVEVLA